MVQGFGPLCGPKSCTRINDTAGKLARWGCGGRGPPRRLCFAPGSGGFAARTRCKTECFLEGKALQTSHLSKPAVSYIASRAIPYRPVILTVEVMFQRSCASA